eukprot:TRINITY_DN10287_c0_g1_i2.p1 TRINITY_DN10287_c0_g1~~TRINITY_DN10287_c0_g1_i2.p1  ORF type:complete len:612 (+),score=276.13 TRINITY_DN10287_c0_g1_i2:907-2742(+)
MESERTSRRRKNDLKYNNILTFLDGVDAASSASLCELDEVPGTHQLTHAVLASHDRSLVESEVSTEAESVFTGVKAKIDRLQKESEHKDKTIRTLLAKIESLKTRETERIQHVKDAAEKHVEMQKLDLESVIQRNVTLINQLISDKEGLTSKVKDLTTAIAQLEHKLKSEQEKAEQERLRDVSNVKNQITVSEKKKREAWIAAETKKIKTAAIKALEPDIAMLLSKHKAEIRRIDEEHQQELRRKDQTIADKDRELLAVGARHATDREDAIGKMREALHEKMIEQSSRLEAKLEETHRTSQREREVLERCFEEERCRHRASMATLESELRTAREKEDEARRALRNALNDERESLRRETDKSLAQERARMEDAKDREVKAVVEELKREQFEEMQRKEKALKERLTREKQEEINIIIGRLEDEAMKHAEEGRCAERRNRERIETLERERDRLLSKVGCLEEETKQLRMVVEEREEMLTNEMKKCKREKERLFEQQVQFDEQLAARLKSAEVLLAAQYQTRMEEARAEAAKAVSEIEKLELKLRQEQQKHDELVDDLRDAHAGELEEVQKRVMTSIHKKDQEIVSHKATIHKLELQIRQTENVFAQHRNLIMSP